MREAILIDEYAGLNSKQVYVLKLIKSSNAEQLSLTLNADLSYSLDYKDAHGLRPIDHAYQNLEISGILESHQIHRVDSYLQMLAKFHLMKDGAESFVKGRDNVWENVDKFYDEVFPKMVPISKGARSIQHKALDPAVISLCTFVDSHYSFFGRIGCSIKNIIDDVRYADVAREASDQNQNNSL